MSLLNLELVEACLAANDSLIKGQQDDITALRQQVTLLRDALKQARHMIYYGEPQLGWSITRIDEVLDATKEQGNE